MPLPRPTLAALFAAAALAGPLGAGDKLEKDHKKWLDSVWPIMLPEEEKLYRDLKKDDRPEFEKIFWARRDPDLATPENEFQAEYLKSAAEADRRYKVGGRPGSATDCGRVFLLLGEPNSVEKQAEDERSGPRAPEIWTFKDRPGMTFKDGQAQIAFDGECRLPQGARLGEQLNQLAEGRIAHPNLDYKRGGDGKLVKLADLLPKPSPVQALLKQPRQEFPLLAQPKLFMRGTGGATYLALLARGEAGGLTVTEAGGKKQASVSVAAQAVDEAGKLAASTPEQEAVTEVGSDGSFLASSGLTLRPGKYTVQLGVLDPQTQRGAVASVPVEVPDLGAGTMAVSQILVLSDVQENVAADPKGPLAAFQLGSMLMVPRFGDDFAKADSIQLLALIYNAQADPATGKSSLGAQYSILRDGKPVTNSEEQSFDTSQAVPAVGPVPLAKFPEGKYTVRLKVMDKLAQQEVVKETTFVVKP
jgi:GWxTD domain-containing protein